MSLSSCLCVDSKLGSAGAASDAGWLQKPKKGSMTASKAFADMADITSIDSAKMAVLRPFLSRSLVF